MNIEDEVKLAIEEFDKFAFERFVAEKPVPLIIKRNDDLGYAIKYGHELRLKPLPELFTHGVEFYGNDEHLMWEIFCFDKWATSQDNQQTRLKLIISSENIRRKTSAALPFDLERAKAGDVVEAKIKSEFVECKFCGITYYGCAKIAYKGESFEYQPPFNDLRMKYPPKLKES